MPMGKMYGDAHGQNAEGMTNQYSHFLSSIPSGGLPSTFLEPTSFQFVDSTVPLDSTYTRRGIQINEPIK